MALPFFRKDRKKTEPSPDGAGPATASPNSMFSVGSSALNQAIVVEEVGGGADTGIGEIAILYAGGQMENVEAALRTHLVENNTRIWHMLFDFYRLTDRKADFDRLGLDFAMRFESSPPAWQSQNADQKAARKETARPLSLPAQLVAGIGEKLSNILTSLDKNVLLRLDFSKVVEVDPDGAQGVADMLQSSRSNKIKFQVSGSSSIIDLLRSRMHANPDVQSYWLMLMSIYQLLGKQTEFEDMAVDFAVTFEVSPPSWEDVQAAQEVAVPEPEIPTDAYKLSGVIAEGSDQIAQLMQYAQPRSEVVIDCTSLVRVDYAYVGEFIGQLMQLLGNGKAVVLQGQNALVNELFCTMGIDQLSTLIPAKLV